MKMDLSSRAKRSVRTLVRLFSPLRFGDLTRTEPVSSVFGLDRGTPIDRYYIDSYLNACSDAISGYALEVGEIKYLRTIGEHSARKSILAPSREVIKPGNGADEIVIGDLTDCTSLPGGRFDCFVCTQTLNFIYDVKAAVRGAHHLLAPGGRFIGTVSGISQISRYDMDRWGDYWRFTTLSLQRLLGESFGQNVVVESFGNALAAQLSLQGVAVEDLPNHELLERRDQDYQIIIGFTASKAAS